MVAQDPLSMVRRGSAWAVIAMFLLGRGWAAESSQDVASSRAPAKSLVQSALNSELAGDNDQRNTKLQQALAQSPDDASAHWQSGQVRVGSAWLSPDKAKQAAVQDHRLVEYRGKRDSAGNTVADQAALARWCQKNGLNDEQRAHWLQVLRLQPTNQEAIQALGLQPHRGMLLTKEQAQHLKLVSRAMERWRPLVAQWRRAAERRDMPSAEIEEQIAKISDSAEMVGLERAIWQDVGAKNKKRPYHDMLLTMMQTLRDNPYPAAAESLVRHAVFSDAEDVRATAIEGLKRRSLDHYVPLLLSALQSPIEASTQYAVDAAGHLIARRFVYCEGALADFTVSLTLSPDARQTAPILKNPSPLLVGILAAARQENLADSQMQAARDRATMRGAVDQANRAIDERNTRVLAVLAETTGLDLGSEPTKWWTWWWQDYNESYSLDRERGGMSGSEPYKPRYEYTMRQNYTPNDRGDQYIEQYLPQLTPHSCFAPGTKVWTLTGLLSIEQVKVGDRVLAQDVESAELAYKAVLAVTVRTPGPRMKVCLGAETIVTTPGHPFWVVGQGWRLTKQLEAGKSMHSLSGGVPIESVEKLETDESSAGFAYNLILADFHSYFVGDRGILVHDNTPRKPTAALLPGLMPQ